ncbi:MAG: hypothetical protein ACXW05_03425 [Gemmatirosa sp.]
MTAVGFSHAPPAGARARAAWDALRRREPGLTTFGLACGALGLAAFVAAAVDARSFGGVRVWLKPAKFFVSIAVFTLSWAWIAGLVGAERQGVRPMRIARRTLVATAAFELAYITLQAARAQASHFNIADPLHAILYALMGLAAVALIGTTVPLAWAVARHPAPDADPDLRRAVVVGLLLTFVLGDMLGGYMSAQAGHAVGPEAGHAAIVGWNRTGGDLRVAHFLGLHAEQVLPAIALAGAAFGTRRPRLLLWLAAAAWTTVTLLAFGQALAGRPFPFG